MRRAASLGRPHRRVAVIGLVFVAISALATVLGPLFVRYGIDHGISDGDAGALNAAVIGYIVVVAIAYLSGRQQYIYVNRAGEAFLRTLRTHVFRHIQKQSLAFFDRNQAGVLVARMTADIESMSELVQWGLMQFLMADVARRLLAGAARAAVVATDARGVGGVPADRRRHGEVPARFERGLPQRAGTGGREPVEHAGRDQWRPGDPGVRARGRAIAPLPRVEPLAVPLPRAQLARVDLVLRPRRVRRCAVDGADDRHRGMAGASRHGEPRHARRGGAPAEQPVRPGAAAQPALQHGPVGRCRSQEAVHHPRYPTRRRRAVRARRASRQRRDRGRRRHLCLRSRLPTGAARRVAQRVRRRTAGARRTDGGRQVDGRQADRPLLRPDRGHRVVRWRRPALGERRLVAPTDGRRAAGGLPVRGHDRRQHPHRPRRRDRRRGLRTRWKRSGCSIASSRCPRASPPRSASAARACRRESASWSPWHVLRSSTRRSSSSTRRRRTSTRAPSWWSNAPSSG